MKKYLFNQFWKKKKTSQPWFITFKKPFLNMQIYYLIALKKKFPMPYQVPQPIYVQY